MTFLNSKLVLILCILAFGPASTVSAQNGPWKINVTDVELADFIEQVATITGKTFVVDPRIRGTVTVISDAELDSEGVYELLLSVLKTHEHSLIENGDTLEVIQSSRARMSAGARDQGDANTLGDMWITHVLDVGHLDPGEIVKTLRLLAPQHAQFSAYPEGGAVVITDRKSNIDGMLNIVNHLKSSSAQKTVVVKLEHLAVRAAVDLLDGLHDNDSPMIKVIGNDLSNSLILRGTEQALLELMGSIELIDQPNAVDFNTRVFNLGHSEAGEISDIVHKLLVDESTAVSSQAGGSVARVQSGAKVLPIESQNAIVVKANPADMRRIETLIEDLDRRQPQVLIEAAIVEVALNDIESIGVELGAADTSEGSIPTVSTSMSGVLGALLTRLSTTEGEIDSSAIVAGLTTPSIAIAELDPDGLSFGAIVNALATTSYMTLLSTPSVTTLNNQESKINVGQNVPFRSANLVFPNEQGIAGLNPTNRDDIGTILTVTPSVHKDLSVRLVINQSIEVVAETTQGIGDAGFADFVTNKREIDAVVVAENRQIIVMGGLIRDELRTNTSRVPVLGSIPVLGGLFRSTRDTNSRTMLIVFIRPTVLTSPEEMSEATRSKFADFWEVTLDGEEEEPMRLEDLFKGRQR